jgi:hypothetical protein
MGMASAMPIVIFEEIAMPDETTSKAARRQIANEFKERKVPRGIFAVRCSATGEAWVGSSPNLTSARNSLWFQLGVGQYRNALLQQAWKQYGETAFALEVLEQFDDETSPLLLNDLYTVKKKEWVQTLAAHTL